METPRFQNSVEGADGQNTPVESSPVAHNFVRRSPQVGRDSLTSDLVNLRPISLFRERTGSREVERSGGEEPYATEKYGTPRFWLSPTMGSSSSDLIMRPELNCRSPLKSPMLHRAEGTSAMLHRSEGTGTSAMYLQRHPDLAVPMDLNVCSARTPRSRGEKAREGPKMNSGEERSRRWVSLRSCVFVAILLFIAVVGVGDSLLTLLEYQRKQAGMYHNHLAALVFQGQQ